MSEFAPGKRVKIIFSVWNLAGIEGNFGTLKERGVMWDWAVDVEFPGALNEVVYFEEYHLELVEDAPNDTPAPIAATTVGVGHKPTFTITAKELADNSGAWAVLKDAGIFRFVYEGDYVDGIGAFRNGYYLECGGNAPIAITSDTAIQVEQVVKQ
jgi:hypothetical protein